MEHKILFAWLSLMSFLALLLPSVQGAGYTLNGSSVYFDDAAVYINVNPHTVTSQDSCTVVTMRGKTYSGLADIALGVDTADLRPNSIYYYSPHTVTTTHSYQCLYNATWNTTAKTYACHTYANATNGTSPVLLAAGSYEWGNVTSKTAYWTVNTTENWEPMTWQGTTVDYTYDGSNKWYILNEYGITGGNQQLRICFDIPRTPLGQQPKTYKYNLGFKRTTDTWNEALNTKTKPFYYIDPWVNGNRSLIAYWNFNSDNGSASIGSDFGTYENVTLKVAGIPTVTSGIIGNARKGFSGSNYYENRTANAINFSAGQPFTLNMWVNKTSCASLQQQFFGMSTTNGQYSMQGYCRTNNNLYIEIVRVAQASLVSLPETYQIPIGNWTMLTFVFNGSNNLSLYANGVFKLSNTGAVSGGTKGNGFAIGNSESGAHAQNFTYDEIGIWYVALNRTDIQTLYNNGTGLAYPFTIASTYADISVNFSTQAPSDVNTSNLITSLLNITYNITGGTFNVSNNTIKLFFKTNSSTVGYSKIINGTVQDASYQAKNMTSGCANNSAACTSLFRLTDNDVLPGTYNYDETILEQTPHDEYSETGANNGFRINFLNVSNETRYGFFEFYGNVTSGANPARVYYCNSSYTTGLYTTSPHCTSFASIEPGQNYSHRHTVNSAHMVIPFPIINGSINTVKVTGTSSFIIRPGSSSSFTLRTINATMRSGVTYETSNTGNAWSDLGVTADAHLHQFSPNTTLYYYACANDTNGTQVCSTSIRNDTIDVSILAPSSPAITYPAGGETIISSPFSINWTAATTPNTNTQVVNYSLKLYDVNNAFVKNITTTGAVTTYSWNWTGTPLAAYIIGITAIDNYNLTSSEADSESFTLGAVPVMVSSTITPTTAYANDTLTFACLANDASGANLTYSYIIYKNASTYLSGGIGCFQEYTNVATSCGGLATGVSWVEPQYYYANYTKPANFSGASWQVKHGTASTYNILLPNSCYNASSTLRLRIHTLCILGSYGTSVPQCYDGSVWQNIGQNITGGCSASGGTTGQTNIWDGNYDTRSYYVSTGTWAINGGDNAYVYEEGIHWMTAYPNGTTQNATTISGLRHYDTYQLQCQAFSATQNSTALNSTLLNVSNYGPIISNLSYTNGTIKNTINITASFNPSDPENDTLTINWYWYKNGANTYNQTYNLSHPYVLASANFTSNNYTYGDRVYFALSVSDATIATTTNSTNITIGSKPNITVNVVNTTLRINDRAYLNCSFYDPDNDGVFAELWPGMGGSNTTCGAIAGASSYGNVSYNVSCAKNWDHKQPYGTYAWLCGGYDSLYGLSEETTATGFYTILNTLPVIGAPTLSAGSIYITTARLNASNGSYTDADGDSLVQWNYTWFKNGAVVQASSTTAYLTNASYAHFDNITVEARAYDGYNWSLPVNSTVKVISNSAPQATAARMTPDTLMYANSTINLYCNGNDPDGDPVYYIWQFYDLGTVFAINTSTFTPSGTEVLAGTLSGTTEGIRKYNNLQVSCLANDSFGASTTQYFDSNVTTVLNSVPYMRTALLNSTTNNTQANLQGWCNATDVDDDKVRFLNYLWKNGSIYTTASYTAYLPQGVTRQVLDYTAGGFTWGNYTLTCAAQDNDTSPLTTAPFNSSVLFINSYYNYTVQNSTTVYESQATNFTLTIYNDYNLSYATFTYNNTQIAATKTTNGYYDTYVASPIIDLVDAASELRPWRWNFTVGTGGGLIGINVSGNQTVQKGYIPGVFTVTAAETVETQPQAFTATITNYSSNAQTYLVVERNAVNTTFSPFTSGTLSNSYTTDLQAPVQANYTWKAWLRTDYNSLTKYRNYSEGYNSSSYQMILQTCGGLTSQPGIGINFADADTGAPINVTAGSGIGADVWSYDSSKKRTYSFSINGTSNYTVCRYPVFSPLSNLYSTYTVIAKAAGYADGSLVKTARLLPSNNTLGLRLTANYSQVRIHIVTLDDQPFVPGGVIVYQYLYNPVTLNASLLSSTLTDFTGVAPFSVNTVDLYIFNATLYNGSAISFNPSPGPFRITQSDYYFRTAVLLDTEGAYVNSLGRWSRNITFSNTTGTCVFNYQALSGTQSYCLRIYNTTQRTDNLTQSQCNATAPGSISLSVPITNGSTYTCIAYVLSPYNNLYEVNRASISIGGSTWNLADYLGLDGLIFAFFFIGIMGFIGLWKPSVAIFLGGAALVFSTAIGLIGVSFMVVLGFALVVVMGALLLVKN